MATLDLEEQEQLEAMKSWWADNRAWILSTLLIIAVVVGGWRGWHYYQNKQASEAAILYAEFEKQIESKDVKRINDAATMVMNKYPSSGYATRAALSAVQLNVELAQDVARAKTLLQWTMDHGKEAGLRNVAALQLAAMLLDEKNYVEAIKLLDTPHQSSFDGLFADLRGDVLSAQGKFEEAKTLYKLAYEKMDARGGYRNLVQMKLDALGLGQ